MASSNAKGLLLEGIDVEKGQNILSLDYSMSKNKTYLALQALFSLVIIAGTIVSLFPPNHIWFKTGTQYTVHIMYIYFALGFLFLFVKDTRLMYVSFICCGLIGAFLQDSFDHDLFGSFYPKPTQEQQLKIAHINVSSSEGDYERTIESILETNADVVSIQELTPDWDMVLSQGITKKYPYSKSVVRIDFHGLAIYSKYPFEKIDTFHFNEIPNITGSIRIDSSGRALSFISSHITPPFSSADYAEAGLHLEKVAAYTNRIEGPVVTFGDYNLVPWSEEIQSYRNATGLLSARRDFDPILSPQSSSIFETPFDHIFYSKAIQCLKFDNIAGSTTNHLGILATFQFKFPHVKG